MLTSSMDSKRSRLTRSAMRPGDSTTIFSNRTAALKNTSSVDLAGNQALLQMTNACPSACPTGGACHICPASLHGNSAGAFSNFAANASAASHFANSDEDALENVGDGDDLFSERLACDPDLEDCNDNRRTLRIGSRGPAVKLVQQALIDHGFDLPAHGVDGVFGAETDTAVKAFQTSEGLTGRDVDGVIGPTTITLLDLLVLGEAPVPAPDCPHPGFAREVSLQPVFFQDAADDLLPTGDTWDTRFAACNRIWNKLGVTFTARSAVTITNAAMKTAGTTDAELDQIRALRSGAGVEVFMMDNDLPTAGGGICFGIGNGRSKIVLSDHGTSDTLLAHEVGHALGLGHPQNNAADLNTVMAPSGSHSATNPDRNTKCNYARITWPARGAETCLTPDV